MKVYPTQEDELSEQTRPAPKAWEVVAVTFAFCVCLIAFLTVCLGLVVVFA